MSKSFKLYQILGRPILTPQPSKGITIMKLLFTCMFYLIVASACGGVKGIPGPPGEQGPRGDIGERGDPGNQGGQGIPGPTGTSCTIQQVVQSNDLPYGGAIISCGETQVLISNGTPGPQGQPGSTTAYSIVGSIDPCGNASNVYDEVVLRLGDGSLLTSLSDQSNGKNTRLSILTDGSYATTDGTNCQFTVATTGNIRTMSWSNGSESWTF